MSELKSETSSQEEEMATAPPWEDGTDPHYRDAGVPFYGSASRPSLEIQNPGLATVSEELKRRLTRVAEGPSRTEAQVVRDELSALARECAELALLVRSDTTVGTRDRASGVLSRAALALRLLAAR